MAVQSQEQPPLVIHTDWSRAWGGQEIRVLTELRELRRRGFRVGLIVPQESELARRAQLEAIPVHGVSRFAKFNLGSWLELFAVIRAIRPTVVNTHSSEDSWMAGAIARLCRVPLIVRTRHVLSPISSALSYNLFPHVIFTCSAAIADQLAAQGVARDKSVVLSSGSDATRFRFSPQHRAAVRQAYQLRDDQVLVGNVAFLRNYKGLPFILRTAAAMPPQYRFMLVGEGSDRPQLEALRRELGLVDRVIFTGHQEQPEHFFSAFDLFFFSSYEVEGISQALVQGLLNGLPVLACPIPSAMEPLGLIEAYRLVDYDDVTAACQGLRELAALPPRDPVRMERQHRIVADRYGMEPMMRTLLATYQRFGVHAPG